METAVDDALIGRLVDGRYRVRSRIARGGMATVYEASDERLGRDVALKVMHPDLAEDDEFVQRFIHEARSAAALSRDRAIVTVYDQGTSDGVVWLALELVRGRTLRQVITERGRLDPRTALSVMDPVLAALAAAHDAGIVHRDVKPENVLVGDDGHVQVADFGLAHAVNGSAPPRGASTRGLLLGTVAYISPEQALGRPATQASDVYAAGVLLYELLTGHPPHDGPTDYVVVRKHVDEDVPAPSTELGDVPAEIDALVAGATARNVPDRYPDAGAFLGAVRRARKTLERDPAARPTGPLTSAAGSGGATVVAGGGAARRSDTNPIHRNTASIDAPSRAVAATVPPNPVTAAAVTADPLESPPTRGRRKRRVVRLVVTLLVLGALGGAAWWWFEGRLVQTPGMVGMTVAQAEQVAESAGLTTVVGGEEYSETIPLDAVVATVPSPGDPVAPGEAVTLLLSLGPERYDVPAIVGSTRAEAESALAERTLVPGQVTRKFSEDVPRGQVISQEPAVGTEVKRSAEVSFVVSKGRQPIDVPAVVGDDRQAAVDTIESAGLLARVGEAFSNDVEKDRVISQDPSDGTLFRGDAVSVVVSLGPETVEVPDVEGTDADEAKAELENTGLVVRTIVLLPAGPNNVLRQAPTEGSTVKTGSEVTIYIF